MEYADTLARVPRRVRVSAGPPSAAPVRLALPGSKYYTLRYALAALLASGESVLRHPAISDDTAVLVDAMRALGGIVTIERDCLRITGCGGRPATPVEPLRMGNAGAVLRLLLGIGALLPQVSFATDHPDSLGQRPNADLLDALRALGVTCEASEPGGRLPITLRGGPPRGGAVSVSGASSSQFVSALLFLAPLLADGLDIQVLGEARSGGFIAATLRVLAEAGIQVDAAPDRRRLRVPGGQSYHPGEWTAPGDVPSAAALLAAGLVTAHGGPVSVAGLDVRDPDVVALRAALARLGVTTVERDGGLTAEAPAGLRGASLAGDAVLDSVPALAALACFAAGETQITGAPTLRLKESNRIEDLAAALRAVGGDVSPRTDGLLVRGTPGGIAGGVTVASHDDHRLAQAVTVAALGARAPVVIEGADAVAKSYPGFFADVARLGAEIERLPEK